MLVEVLAGGSVLSREPLLDPREFDVLSSRLDERDERDAALLLEALNLDSLLTLLLEARLLERRSDTELRLAAKLAESLVVIAPPAPAAPPPGVVVMGSPSASVVVITEALPLSVTELRNGATPSVSSVGRTVLAVEIRVVDGSPSSSYLVLSGWRSSVTGSPSASVVLLTVIPSSA